MPGAPPRKVEADALNSTALRVAWKPPLQGKQHGQIRGYQVVFSRLENGEPRGQPNLLDVSLPEAQVRACLSQFTPPTPSPPTQGIPRQNGFTCVYGRRRCGAILGW